MNALLETMPLAGRTAKHRRGRGGFAIGQLEPGSHGAEFYKLPTAQPMSRRQKANRLSHPFPQAGHRNSDRGLQQEGLETVLPRDETRLFNAPTHQAARSGEYRLDIHDRVKTSDGTGGRPGGRPRQPPVITEEQLDRRGMESGSMQGRPAIREDDQSTHAGEAGTRPAGGFGGKARPFKSLRPGKPGAADEDAIPMFGTQPPLDPPYKTQSEFRKAPRIKGFAHAKAA